jgi:hypothetical protein
VLEAMSVCRPIKPLYAKLGAKFARNEANFHLHTILYGLIAPLLDR